MKAICLVCAAATVTISMTCVSAFSAIPWFEKSHLAMERKRSKSRHHPIVSKKISMSDVDDDGSFPSDSSIEDRYDVFAVDVESETYVPSTPNEVLVTSVLDELPSFVAGNISRETRANINEALLKLEAMNPTGRGGDDNTLGPAFSPLLNGVWTLKYAGGYSTDLGLPNGPSRSLALYSPGLFALSIAQKLPTGLLDLGDLEISISRQQPRIEARIEVKLLGGSINEVVIKARLDVESDVRFRETFESATVLGQNIDLPSTFQYSRDLYVTYVDEDILVVRDTSGVPEILVRK